MNGRSRPAEADFPPPLGRDPNPGLWISFLYTLYDFTWTLLIVGGSPWWVTRSLYDRDFRRMVRQRLTLALPELPCKRPGRRRVQVHGVSVGEIKASQSLVRSLVEQHEVIVSASTDTGIQIARQVYPDLKVVRFPLDHSIPVGRFLRHVEPDLVVLMELEIWPRFLRGANRRAVPVAIVNGRITEASFRTYRRFGATLPQFNRVTVFAAQDECYAERFARLAGSDERVVVTGNVKVDGLRTGPVAHDERFAELQRLAGARAGQAVIVAGSTHSPEERDVTGAFQRGAPDARIILVPRHPGRAADIAADLASGGTQVQLLTRLRAGERPDPARPLVVDTIGELERVYGLADLVFVGGSLIPHGGQNMLEPAAQGLPVIYGPHVANFAQEAAFLEEAGASLRVRDAHELEQSVHRLMADEELRGTMAAAGVLAVEGQRGASELSLRVLRERCGLD